VGTQKLTGRGSVRVTHGFHRVGGGLESC
jgi:hypothetical protein